MKSSWELVLVLAGITCLHVYKAAKPSAITGSVLPSGSAESILAIHKKDSLKMVSGHARFILQTKPGIYRVIVTSKLPYKDRTLHAVEVKSGETTDLGELKLIQ